MNTTTDSQSRTWGMLCHLIALTGLLGIPFLRKTALVHHPFYFNMKVTAPVLVIHLIFLDLTG